jgi:hypothetical protein
MLEARAQSVGALFYIPEFFLDRRVVQQTLDCRHCPWRFAPLAGVLRFERRFAFTPLGAS